MSAVVMKIGGTVYDPITKLTAIVIDIHKIKKNVRVFYRISILLSNGDQLTVPQRRLRLRIPRDRTGHKSLLRKIKNSTDRARSGYGVYICECGKIKTIRDDGVRSGAVVSCGCFHTKVITKHKKWNCPEYGAWNNMRHRCHNPKNRAYPDYGGRGISVCNQWRDDSTGVVQFLKDMGPRPTPKHTIERRDNNDGYTPNNCYWGTKRDQARNRRSSRMLKWNGQSKCLAEWSEITGIPAGTISSRIDKYGWSPAAALSTPTCKRGIQ